METRPRRSSTGSCGSHQPSMAFIRGRERASGGPEYKIIQAPEIIRRLTRVLGLKQMHVSPALNEGVQPVVLLADVSKQPTSGTLGTYRGNARFVATALLPFSLHT